MLPTEALRSVIFCLFLKRAVSKCLVSVGKLVCNLTVPSVHLLASSGGHVTGAAGNENLCERD